ncbi:MAG: serine/threonine-protein kinase, partial [Planctomycetota bacterium]
MAAATPVFAVGERLLDRFRIDAVFTGGMGILCAVTDGHTGRRYAVKTVKPGHRGDPDVLRRFLDEARTWIDLDFHVNLVQALWLIDAPPAPLLFLEYVAGPDLAALLERGPLPLARALDFAMQCASGMAYAHGKPLGDGIGIVHRDLKPSNLLVAPDDVLKISDFGLARVFRARAAPAGDEGVGVGTPAYMAPEQLRGTTAVDGRADIYSFGLVLYEMLTGTNPLRSPEISEQVRRILDVVPAPLADVPAALAGLVSRCVAKSPADRPRDFREVLAHLAQAARELEHRWHVDPRSVPAPSAPAGVAV